MRNKELAQIERIIKEHGGRVARKAATGNDQLVVVEFPDDPRAYRYFYANKRDVPERIARRDFFRAINRERDNRQKPRL